MKVAVVAGVGPLEGLGSYLCLAASTQNLHVVVSGRTLEKLDATVKSIEAHGGAATAIVCDVTEEQQVVELLRAAAAIGEVDLAIFNAGNNMPGSFLEVEAKHFEKCWRIASYGGFLFAREALKAMAPRGDGCLLFTGASASMRGRPGYASFTSAKGGLRNMAQSLAREFHPQGVHVAHVVIDGGIRGEKIAKLVPDWYEEQGEEGLIGLQGIADAYMYLYQQPRNAWTHELDLRTHGESF
jgi:NAD(P)-dependent dehydrogenase (short-subunit alcohol dehydrogenase family)